MKFCCIKKCINKADRCYTSISYEEDPHFQLQSKANEQYIVLG